MIPTLDTPRLILREFREADFPDYARLCSDADVMRYLGVGAPWTAGEAWRHFAFMIGHWHLRGYGPWAVEEKESGRFIGRIGFLNPEGWPDFELGWTLAKEHWGRGLATEGARRALRYAFLEMDRDHVISLIHPENRASIRVAEHLGARQAGTAVVFGREVRIYRTVRTPAAVA